MNTDQKPAIAIACGGTGGHLFPGLAVAEQFTRRNCPVTLLVSPKEVDQQAVKDISGLKIVTLPAVGLSRGNVIAFIRGFARSWRAARSYFRAHPPEAALAMGGFTSAPPILAARSSHAATFLHESNTIPGRANRWLARIVDRAFVGFPEAAKRIRAREISVTGTPVRSQFQPRDAGACRQALGLDPNRPVLLVMGGSQGASGINHLVVNALPLLARGAPDLQLVHLAGPHDAEEVSRACAALNLRAVVHAFFNEMELVLGAATVAVSRAGASSLAELAAMRVPAVLIPYPAATENHQFHNARAFETTGAARLLVQKGATPGMLTHPILNLLANPGDCERMREALGRWHAPKAAEQIAESMLAMLSRRQANAARAPRMPDDNAASRTAERHDFSAA